MAKKNSNTGRRQRSPSFPYLNIGEAIECIKKLYEKEKMARVPVHVAVERMGYSATSSTSARVLSTLLGYELIRDEGTKAEKVVWISDLAKTILLHHDSNERRKAVRQAVLSDELMERAWETWKGSLPSQETIKSTLIFKFNFTNERAASRFASVIIENFEYADLEGGEASATVLADSEDEQDIVATDALPEQSAVREREMPEQRRPSLKEYAIPIVGGTAYLKIPVPISERNLGIVQKWIDAMEEALTTAEE